MSTQAENNKETTHTNMLQKAINKVLKGDQRSVKAKKNILGSLFLKGISILISLQVVPLTINYVNPTKYGIWLTLSSIIAWLSYFDLGFAHGFRNKFAEAKASNDIELAKQYVSTTYAVLSVLFGIIFIIALFINNFLNWSNILNIEQIYNQELHLVFQILLCFFCMNIVASIFTTMLTADQKPALATFLQTAGQVFAFITIYILTKTTQGDLSLLAFAFSGIPCIFLVITSIIVFSFTKYKIYAPSFRSIKLNLIKNILSLGGQFFFIMISMLFIFQFINIIISQELGPTYVTQYNIAFKYFNVLAMISNIVLTPFWSAYTEAYTQRDFDWMKQTCRRLERLWWLTIPIGITMVLCSSFFYKLWIGNSVDIPVSLSISMCIYIVFQILGNIYMYQINGTGKVRIQLLIYLSFAIIAIPILRWGCRSFGVEGILIIPSIVFFLQAILGRIQLYKITNYKAIGIWNK